jgi:hypothetical protein
MYCKGENMLKRLILFTMILLLSMPAMGMNMRRDDYYYTPPPRLVAPTSETVDLSGKKELEFRWSPHEGRRGTRIYYDFRLYSGYDMLESMLLIKKKIDPSVHRISIESDVFKDKQVYTWSLRQAYSGIYKSDRSIASFEVIKHQ